MVRLLVADDEINIGSLIQKYAAHQGYECDVVLNGEDAVNKCLEKQYDLLILDVMMPYKNGFEALEEIRRFSNIPVILLTAKSEEYDRVFGFDLGADDYVVKPFSVKELMMRVQAILKRLGKTGSGEQVFGRLKINYQAYSVSIDNENLDLSPKEYKLLTTLVQNKNITMSRDALIEEVWGYDYEGDDRTLDTHIKLLRAHLGAFKDIIVTVRGVGYRFDENKALSI